MMAQLGKAIGIVMRFEHACQERFDDLACFYAPSECYTVVERANARRFRIVRRHACSVAGVKNMAQLRRAIKRVCPTWDRYNHYRLGLSKL